MKLIFVKAPVVFKALVMLRHALQFIKCLRFCTLSARTAAKLRAYRAEKGKKKALASCERNRNKLCTLVNLATAKPKTIMGYPIS